MRFCSTLGIALFVIMIIANCNNGQNLLPSEEIVVGSSSTSTKNALPPEEIVVGSSGVSNKNALPPEEIVVGSSGVSNKNVLPPEEIVVGSSGVSNKNVPPGASTGTTRALGSSTGEPQVAYHTPAGYIPSYGDPLVISKVVTPIEGGKSVGNKLLVKVEVAKRDNTVDDIDDLDIYEFVDDSLRIVPPEDNYSESLINYAKSSDIEEIGELQDKLSRNDPYSSSESELHGVILPELEPETCNGKISKFTPRLKLNLTNISQDLSDDRKNLLKLLRDDFNLKWAFENDSNITYMPNIINKRNIIYINDTKDNKEIVRLKIVGLINASRQAIYKKNNYTVFIPFLSKLNWSNITESSLDRPNILELLVDDSDLIKCKQSNLNITHEHQGPEKGKGNCTLHIKDIKDINNNTAELQVDIMMNTSINATNNPNICCKLIPYLLKANWSNISINSSEERCILNLAKDELNIGYAFSNSSNIRSNHLETIDVKNNTEIIYIENNDKYNRDYVKICINNSSKNKGKAIMNIAGLTTYDLDFYETSGSNKRWINDWNGVLKFHVNDFSSRDRLFYWYYVKPKKSGVFGTESIARIFDKDYKGWHDITYPIEIEVSEPDLKFEVVPILESSNVYAKMWYSWLPIFNEKLDLKYSITYRGSAGAPYNDNIKVKRQNQSTAVYDYLDRDGSPLLDSEIEKPLANLSFSNIKSQIINSSIIFNKAGKHQIPGILIGDKLYTFSDTIIVDGPISRNKEIILFIMAVTGFLLGLLFNRELKTSIASISGRCRGIIIEEKKFDSPEQKKLIEDQIRELKDRISALENQNKEKEK